jgi:hypothetical protein
MEGIEAWEVVDVSSCDHGNGCGNDNLKHV